MPNKLSIIIVSYNSQDFIERCINSLLKNIAKDTEVIIVDNASTDNTLHLLEKSTDSIKLIKSEKNLGFAKACNLGANNSSGKYLFFLNPDTEVQSPIFDELINFYESQENIGIVAPKLIMPDGIIQPSVMNLPTVIGAFRELILGQKNEYLPYSPGGDQPVRVQCVFAAAILIEKSLFEKIGGFSEEYFLYYEDIDLCRKLAHSKKSIYYYPRVSIKHIVGGVKSENKYNLNLQSSVIYNGYLKTLLLQIIFRFHRLIKR